MSEYICENGQGLLSRDMSIVQAGGFADGEVVKVVHGEGVSCLEELQSTQEEADTRLLLHSIVLWTIPGSDVMTPTSLFCYSTIQAKECRCWQTRCTSMQGIQTRSSRRNAIFHFTRSPQSWAIPFATAYSDVRLVRMRYDECLA